MLGEYLHKKTGIAVAPEQWQGENLDPWYCMNFILEDESGTQITMARSLEKLQQDFKQQISQGLEQAAEQSADDNISRQDITDWDFEQLPQEVALKHGKVTIKAWPSLRDCGQSVSLEVVDNPLLAEQSSRQGQLRLALIRGREQVKYLGKQLLKGKELALTAAKLGERKVLVDALVSAAFCQAMFADGRVLREQQQFEQAFEQGIGRVVTIGQEYAEIIESLLQPLHEVQKKLRTLGLSAIYAAEDINNQLSWLFSAETLSTLRPETIRQYPRYIKALQLRLEKLGMQINRDRQSIDELQEFLQPCREALVQDQPLSHELETALRDFCWLLEEYRVSLFAQQLKTRVPVSEKRLRKRWDELDDELRRFRV